MYTAEAHGATYSDYMPIGEIRCLIIGGEDVAHYMVLCKDSRVQVTLLARTDDGTGPTWYDVWGPWLLSSEEGAAQLISDHHLGVTRIATDDGGTARWQGNHRLEDATL